VTGNCQKGYYHSGSIGTANEWWGKSGYHCLSSAFSRTVQHWHISLHHIRCSASIYF